jgi:hypothetical protein
MSKSLLPTWNTEKLRVEVRPGAWKRRTATAARWLHIYGSMVSLSLLLFFSVTGLTLNHADWFAAQQRTAQYQGQVPLAWMHGDLAKLEIVEHLRQSHGIKTGMSAFRSEEGQASVSFAGPGYTADVVMDRTTGRYEVTETRMGLAAVLNDLHKGRDTGPAWSLLLDVSAGLMVLVSFTGLVLLCYLQRKRVAGMLSLAGGTLACYLVYAIWVP